MTTKTSQQSKRTHNRYAQDFMAAAVLLAEKVALAEPFSGRGSMHRRFTMGGLSAAEPE